MFTRSVPLFKLLGFRVSVDLSWIVLAVLVTWTLAVGAFPMLYPDLSAGVYWAMGVAGMIGLVFSIVVHEFAHSLVARHYDMPMRGITLFIFGGVAEMEDEPTSARAEFWVAIVGPIASFIVAAAFQVLAIGTQVAGGPVSVSGVLAYLAMINVILAVFNLVPAFPLDGGRVLRAALWGWKGSFMQATRIATSAGAAFGVLLMVLAVVNILAGNFVPGMWWFLLGLFVRGAAQGTMQQTMVSEALSDVPIRRFMTRDPITVEPSLSVDELVEGFFYRHYHKLYPVVEGSRLVGCVNLGDVKQVPREEWTEKTVRDIMRDCSDENTVAPDAEAVKVLRRMMRSGVSRMLVVEDGRLVGILAQSEIMRFLAVKMDLDAGGGPGGIPAPGSPRRRNESRAGA